MYALVLVANHLTTRYTYRKKLFEMLISTAYSKIIETVRRQYFYIIIESNIYLKKMLKKY